MDTVALRAADHVLTAPDESDVDRIHELCQDPLIQRWTTVPIPYERHHAEGFVREFVVAGWARGTTCICGIRPHAEEPLVGIVGLNGIEGGSATIGYWLAPSARGRGLATASVRAAVDFAFGPLALTRLAWDAAVGNDASRRVAERVGFRVEGQVRGWYFVRGAREDAWLGTLYAQDLVADAPTR